MPRAPELALHAAVLALLRSRDPAAASLFERAALVVCPTRETWQLGERDVTAQRIALVVDPGDWVELEGAPARRAAVHDALRDAVASFETALAEMPVFLRLPLLAQPWGDVYRQASTAHVEPSEREVHAGAVRLLLAQGEERARRALDAGWLEIAPVDGLDGTLRRVVVHLRPEDAVAIERDGRLFGVLTSALRVAATSALTRVVEVSIGLAG